MASEPGSSLISASHARRATLGCARLRCASPGSPLLPKQTREVAGALPMQAGTPQASHHLIERVLEPLRRTLIAQLVQHPRGITTSLVEGGLQQRPPAQDRLDQAPMHLRVPRFAQPRHR